MDETGEWPRLFEIEASRLRRELGPYRAEIEHVGSTAVPGLDAKPILDIAIGLADDVDVKSLVSTLQNAGYIYGGDEGAQGGVLLVGEDRPGHRRVHIHVVRITDQQWDRYLAVRNRLRNDESIRTSYAALKRELAARFPDDRAAYTAGKADFIASLASTKEP